MAAIDIKLKKSATKTIKLDNGIELAVDYPTASQWSKLQELLYQVFLIDEEINNCKDSFKVVELKARKISLMNEYMKQFLRYTIKDIKGIDGEIKVVNNELDNESYEAITYDLIQVRTLYDLISSEINFDEVDKKK